MIEPLKRLLAVVILICMFLPIAQCSSTQPAKDMKSVQIQKIDVLVPVDAFLADWRASIPMVFIYLWPLLFVGLRRFLRSARVNAAARTLEVLLASASLYVLIETIQGWGTIRYGGVVAIAAFAAYLLVAGISLGRYLHERSNKASRERAL
jgi:cation transport ATPase